MDFHIVGARALLPGDTIARPADIHVADGRVQRIGVPPAPGARVVHAGGLTLLPGICDLHGDAFERQLMPRPKVRFPTNLALVDTDRQMLANGITTAFHGLTWSWEPGLRGRDAALTFLDALDHLRPRLGCDTRVHLRHEVYNVDAADQIVDWLAGGRIHLLAFNDHLPMFRRRLDRPQDLAQYAERAHMDLDAFAALIRAVGERAAEVAPTNARLAAAARAAGLVMASHDDDSPATTRAFHHLGCTLCEFPLTEDTATAARALGNAVIMGAPNVVRGGSHLAGGLTAAAMVKAGLVDVLTSDYFYPALPQAVFRLVADGVTDLGTAWALVSTNPARAAGLTDRGAIAAGQRADLVLVDDADPALPRVLATFVAGRPAFAADSFDSPRARPLPPSPHADQ